VDWFLLNAGFDGSAQAASDFSLLLDNLLGNVRERFEVRASRGCTHPTQIDDIDQRHQRPGLGGNRTCYFDSILAVLVTNSRDQDVTYRLIGNGEGSPWAGCDFTTIVARSSCTTRSTSN